MRSNHKFDRAIGNSGLGLVRVCVCVCVCARVRMCCNMCVVALIRRANGSCARCANAASLIATHDAGCQRIHQANQTTASRPLRCMHSLRIVCWTSMMRYMVRELCRVARYRVSLSRVS